MAKSAPKPSPKPAPKYRDAGTGEYVPKKYADSHPKTTVKETVKAPPKKK
jgi:hypothetical protein